LNKPALSVNPDLAEPDATGFVLAGGKSSRMGEDKALVELAGQPLVVHALNILREAGLTVSLAGGSSKLLAFAPVIEDSTSDLGPLGGICAALALTPADWAVFVSVDLPLLPASLIAYMLAHARITGSPVTVPSVNGFPQTFPAVLNRAVLPVLESELKAGRGGCFSGFQAAAAKLGQPITVLPVEFLAQSGHATQLRTFVMRSNAFIA
jgi:molybdenum cofactor guanylyltransferase